MDRTVGPTDLPVLRDVLAITIFLLCVKCALGGESRPNHLCRPWVRYTHFMRLEHPSWRIHSRRQFSFFLTLCVLRHTVTTSSGMTNQKKLFKDLCLELGLITFLHKPNLHWLPSRRPEPPRISMTSYISFSLPFLFQSAISFCSMSNFHMFRRVSGI